MRIAFDVAGFERDLSEAVKAAARFVKKYPQVTLLLVGDGGQINALLPKKHGFKVIHATQQIEMSDDISAIRTKPDASMIVAIGLVKDGHADGVVSAGSTAPFVAASNVLLGTLPNVRRAAFMPWLPSANEHGTYMLDVGANKECTATDLRQFAIMGSVCFSQIKGKPSPVVKVLNIGTEANKGLQIHADTANLLQATPFVNYQGFIESRDLLTAGTDVVVCDGYAGNLTLKCMEGSMRILTKFLLGAYKRPSGWLGGLFSLPVLWKVFKRFDYRHNAGALVVGLNKVAVKTHGSADCAQFLSSLVFCMECISKNVISQVNLQLQAMQRDFEPAGS